MKKTLKIFVLMLIAILALTALVACGGDKYPTNPDKAKEALEKDGYEVEEADASDIAFWAELLGVEASDITAIFEGWEESTGKIVVLFYFKDSAAADKAWNGEFVQEMVEDAKNEKDFNLEKKGSLIVMEDIQRSAEEGPSNQ